MRRVLLLAAVIGAALALAPSASAVYEAFRTPSGNIGCIYAKFSGEPAYLRCDILSKLKPLPPRPASCPDYVEWGYGFWMGKTGSAKVVCAVNRDENAPIFALADFGIVGDLYEVVPKIIEALKT